MSETPTLSPLQRAFLALEDTQDRLAAAEGASREPIAIIGLGCRVPGADDPAAFWRLLRDGVDAVGPVPGERFDLDALYDPNPETPGRTATREAGFVGEVDSFDPAFFGISPREAQGMDPQQRLLLEVTWEALEHAGQAPNQLERSSTGIYVGVCSSDYAHLMTQAADPALLDAHYTSGVAHSVASGRLSYVLGLQGPSLSIDTACSSSLVAVHLACQALKTRECRMALAGGVNLMLSADLFVAFSHSRMLARDGRCKTFDASADGFGRGEGCGVVVLKRLSDAAADGDRVLAVIRGSAVNQDGPSSGLTAPNGPQQEAVIREALARAGLAPKDVGYIEAHGTGTELGDPLEVQALGGVFGAGRDADHPLMLGSVKTNIGHLEAAAGITGLIKLVLSLRNRAIPAHLHFSNPSPHIPWADLPLRVPTSLTPWAPIAGRRIGGVSSFGFSGTNAHVVVEEAPDEQGVRATTKGPSYLMAISARDEAALGVLADRYADALKRSEDVDLPDLCHTANAGRAHFAVRATIKCRTIAGLRDGLRAVARGDEREGVSYARVPRGDPRRVAFLFTGQGSQYAGMARELYESAPAFRTALDRCARILEPHLEHPLLEVLFPAPGAPALLDETAYTQPALFAVEYALTELLRTWGVAPAAVMGHSVGEYVAACVAGVMTFDDALRLIATRGRLMQALPAGGAMAAIFAPEADVTAALASHEQRLSIAAVNTAAQTVISGAKDAVDHVVAQFSADGVRCQPLTVSHAFHSPLVDPMLDAFERVATEMRFAAPKLRMISNLTGAAAVASEVTRPTYWRRHVREGVQFATGLRTLAALKPDIYLEVGPHPTLLSFASAEFGEGGPPLLATLRKGRADREQVVDLLASLYLQGVDLDWRGVDRDSGRRVVDLPTYPFQRERYWFRSRANQVAARSRGRRTGHPLLGTRLRSPAAGHVFEARMSADEPAFVREHKVQGRIVLPATAFLETLAAAANDALGAGPCAVVDVTVQEAMILDEGGAGRTVQVVCMPTADGGLSATVCSLADDAGDADPWTQHVSATIITATAAPESGLSLHDARSRCGEQVAPQEFYAGFAQRGLDFGDGFRSIRSLGRGDGEALGAVELNADLAAGAAAYRMHPVLLDGCLQVLAAAVRDDGKGALYLPIGFGRYQLYANPGTSCAAYAWVEAGSGETRRADIRVFSASGDLIAVLSDVRLKRVARDALEQLGTRWLDDALYEMEWVPAPAAGSNGDDAPTVATLAAAATAAIGTLRSSAGLESYDRFLPRFEALCADYTVQAMTRLGWNPTAGESVSPVALADRLHVAPQQRRLFGRLLAILSEVGLVTSGENGWTVVRPFPAVDPARDLAALAQEYPSASAELELTARTSAELAEALRGECDPMQLLFPAGSIETTERMYRDAPTGRFFNGLVAEVLASAVAGTSHGRPLRVLEVGAGTGGTTSHVVPRLPSSGVEYTFTDVGPLFVSRARNKFGAFPFLRYEVFDLEREPEEQGFAAGSFDVIIGANVIHATTDLRRTLARVRRLLTPGGMLAMLEVTAPQRWFDLTVGLTKGWWAFTDADLRPDYATLSKASWLTLLAECGFGDATALPKQPPFDGVLGLQSLFLARAAASTPAMRDWLLFADQGGTADSLTKRLRGRGDHCTVVHHGDQFGSGHDAFTIDAASAEDHRRVLQSLREVGHTPSGVLHLWSLDTARWDAMTPKSLSAAQAFGAVSALFLAQALIAEREPARLWLVTRGGQQGDALDNPLSPAQAPAWGLGKVIALEHPEVACVLVDLDPGGAADDIERLLAELDEPGTERQVALRTNGRRVARLARLGRSRAPDRGRAAQRPWRLTVSTRGSLEQLSLEPAQRRGPGPGEVEIAVEATGLNFKDVLNVLGLYPGDPGPLGSECAGTVTAVGVGVTHVRPGDDVLAVAGGSFASHVLARAEFVQQRPPGQTAEEGAAFPIAFLTAEFCLGHLAGMRAEDRVLIHAAAGGVGMAAVRLAQRAGATVFATAGSPTKRDLLRGMGVAHVFDSRSADFADEILARTEGHGVDVVLNSLSGDLIDASFRALARGGRFVEIGKRGIKTPAWVEALDRHLRYFIVDWGETGAREPALIGGMLARLVDELRQGTLAPLPRHVFALDEAERAFRFMTQARHAGKIVVRHGAPAPAAIRRDGSYLVTGGLSGLGPEVARWLVERGAGRVVLIGRRGVTLEVAPLLDTLRAQGARVVAEAVDVTDEAAMRALLARVRQDGPPLRGVVHSAGVLDDAGLLQQDATRFAHVFGPKVLGGYLLDTCTRADPLDWFVLFSSVASVLGSPGQSNHSAANAFLDLLARERRSRGLPGLSINWCAWTEVGAAVDRGVAARIAAQGLGAVSPSRGLLALERLLGQDHPQVAVLPVDWRAFREHAGRNATTAFLSDLAGVAAAPAAAASTATARTVDLREQLSAVAPGRRRPMVAAFVRERALRALGVDPSRAVDPRTPLGELGLDSLLAVELRNTLGTALGRSQPATLLFDYPTIDTLTDYLLNDVLELGAETPLAEGAPAAERTGDLVGSIEDLSDDEVDRQLAARAQRKT